MTLQKKGLALVAAGAAAAIILAGCSNTPPESPPSSTGDTTSSAIILANGTEPQNPLIPTSTNEVGGGRILTNLFAGLVYYDAKGVTQMDMAESVTTDDNKVWTAKIKPGQTFSNGEPVNAAAFVDAWNWAARGVNAQLNSSWFAGFEGYDPVSENQAEDMTGLAKVDDLTFTVTLADADPNFVLQLGYSAYYPLPKSFFDDTAAYGQNPIGNGPYKLAKESGAWQHNIQIDLIVNETYTGPRQPVNGGVTYKFYQDDTAAYADLQSGQLDVIDQMAAAYLAVYESELGANAIAEPGSVFQSFTIPGRLPHFSGDEGKLRRQALSYAIDRAEICEVVFSGSRTPAKDFSSPLMPGWSDAIEGNEVLSYNPDKAKDLWAQADAISPWEGKFQIAYNADGPHAQWVEAVLNSIGNTLGIETEPAPYPTFQASRTAITDRTIQTAFRTGWQADYPSIHNYLYTLYGSQAADGKGSNDGDYKNPEFDVALAAGLTKDNMLDSAVEFNKAQAILMRDLPAIPLWYQNVAGGKSSAVDNVIFGWDNVPIIYLITKA